MNKEKQQHIIEEKEANQFITRGLIAWSFIVVITELLNEIGIFYVAKWHMRIACGVSALITVIAAIMTKKNKDHYFKGEKYILVSLCVLQLFICLVTLNFHALLVTVVPIMGASYYRDRKLILFTMIASVLVIPVAFWLSMVFDTYGARFLSYLIYCYNPSILTAEVQESMTEIAPWLKGSALGVVFFVGVPNMMLTMVAGYMAIIIFKGRERIHTRQIEEIKNIQDSVTTSMSEVVENRDNMTGGHVKRTSDVMKIFAEELRKEDTTHSDFFWKTIVKTAPLHDLGKISIDDAILRKPGKLTDEEIAVIRTHPSKSATLIENVFGGIEDEEYVTIAKNIGKHHHEWWNGKGYPDGLKEEHIPYEARIMAYVDVLDALLSKRSYKEAFSYEKALEIIRNDCGRMFDPNLFPTFERVYPKIIEYYEIIRKNEPKED